MMRQNSPFREFEAFERKEGESGRVLLVKLSLITLGIKAPLGAHKKKAAGREKCQKNV